MSKITKTFNTNYAFDINFEKDFVSLKELRNSYEDGHIHLIHGVGINGKSKYGAHPFLETNSYLVDLPKHMLDTCKQILDDTEMVEEIKEGIVGFKIRTYIDSKFNKECYTIEFVDI